VREQLLACLDRLEAEQRNRSETWGRLVLSGGQEVPGYKAEKLLRTLGKDAEKALGSTDSVRIGAVVDRAAHNAGVMPLMARPLLVRLLAAELKVPVDSGPSAPRSARTDWVAMGYERIEGKSSYSVEDLVQQLRRDPDGDTNPLMLFFGVADESFIRNQVTEVHRGILRCLGGNNPVIRGADFAARNAAWPAPPDEFYKRVSFEVTNLDFGIQHDEVRRDGRPVAVAVAYLHVAIRPRWYGVGAPDRVALDKLDKSLVVQVASPVSGGRNTVDGLCHAAADEIAKLIGPPGSGE
jgi:hypothetical protein